MDANIKRILDAIEKVSPEAWQQLIHFIRVDAVSSMLVALVIGSISAYSIHRLIKSANQDPNDVPHYVVLGVIPALGLFLSLSLMQESFTALVATDGYAINKLIKAAK